MRRLYNTAVFLIGMLALGTANAGIVFDNGGPAQNGVGVVSGGSTATLDDFIVGTTTILTDGHFWTIEDRTAVWDGSLIYTIWSDNNGAPGSIITGGLGQNVTKTLVGPISATFNEYAWDFDFAAPFVADPGVNYWFGLFLGAGSQYLYWEQSTAGQGQNSYVILNNDLKTLTQTPLELAFYLTGTKVPVAAPWALMLLGLVPMVIVRRRRS